MARLEMKIADYEPIRTILERAALLEAAVAEALEDDREFAATEHGRKLKAVSDSLMAASRDHRDHPRVEVRG